MRKRTAESGILRACIDLLSVHKIWHERRNTGAMKDGDRFIRFSRKGTADIMATPISDKDFPFGGDLEVLWIECKASKGKQSEDQIAFEKEVSMAGHQYLVVRDVNTLSAWLKEHGCI